MANQNNFNPYNASAFNPYGTVSIASGATSSIASFTNTQSIGAACARIYHTATVTVFVAFGIASVATPTATTPSGTESSTSIPCPPSLTTVVIKGAGSDTVAAISAAAGTVYISAGEEANNAREGA